MPVKRNRSPMSHERTSETSFAGRTKSTRFFYKRAESTFLKQSIEACAFEIDEWMRLNKLKLNSDKSELLVIYLIVLSTALVLRLILSPLVNKSGCKVVAFS